MNKFENLESEFEDLKKSVLSSSSAELLAKIEALQANVSALSTSLETIESSVSTLSEKASSLQTSLSSLSTEVDTLDSAVVHITGTETITGAKTFSNSVMVGIGTMIQADSNGAMEFGRKDGTTATPYIDFHTDGLATTDYNVRILANGTQLRITAASGLLLNSNTLVDSSCKIPIDRLNFDTEITSDATDSNVPTSKAVYDLASSMGSETIYVHVITMQHITYLTEVGMQIFSKSSEEMDFGDVASWLFLHGYTKHSKGLPLTGGAYTGTTGQPYVYATVYSANGTNISGRYYTGATTGQTGFGTGTNWQTYDTVYEIE